MRDEFFRSEWAVCNECMRVVLCDRSPQVKWPRIWSIGAGTSFAFGVSVAAKYWLKVQRVLGRYCVVVAHLGSAADREKYLSSAGSFCAALPVAGALVRPSFRLQLCAVRAQHMSFSSCGRSALLLSTS